MSEEVEHEQLLSEEDKRRVAKMATEEAIDKVKLNPKYKALPRKEQRKLLRKFRKNLK